jgi:hypothetical protein
VSSTDEGEELFFADLFTGHDSDDLLGKHIDRFFRDAEHIQFTSGYRIDQSDALNQIIPTGWEQSPLGFSSLEVAGSPDALEEGRDGMGATELAHQIHITHVDPQFK